MFFKEQERTVSFYSVSNAGGFDTATSFLFEASGICSFGSASLDPEVIVSSTGAMGLRFFASKSYRSDFSTLAVADIIVVDGGEFEITKIDARGVLPSKYPLRVEAVRKI